MKEFFRKELSELLDRFFGQNETKTKAKERLRFILVHDRSQLDPEKMDALRKDLFEVLSKYVEMSPGEMDIQFEKENDSIALIANIPIQSVKRH